MADMEIKLQDLLDRVVAESENKRTNHQLCEDRKHGYQQEKKSQDASYKHQAGVEV